MNMRNLKGQFWSFDVIFSVVIFGVAITVMAFTWFNINNELALAYGNGATLMELQLQTLSQNLLSPGTPADWQALVNTTNSLTWTGMSVGLTDPTGKISPDKLNAIASMASYNYQGTKQQLGIAFDYYVTVASNPSYGAGINASFGRNPLKNRALTVYTQSRSSFIDGIPVIVNITMWTNTTLAAR